MKNIYFGGSFNPITNSHLLIAQYVQEAMDAQIIFMPCANAPHKKGLEKYEIRADMIRLAIQSSPRFQITDIEKDLYEDMDSPSYTINTVLKLKERGEREVYLLVGDDCLKDLNKWHRSNELQQLVRFVVVPRERADKPPVNVVMDDQGMYFLSPQKGKIRDGHSIYIDIPLFQLSSTIVRERAKSCLPIDYMVPPLVAKFIQSHNLYK